MRYFVGDYTESLNVSENDQQNDPLGYSMNMNLDDPGPAAKVQRQNGDFMDIINKSKSSKIL